MGCFKILCSDFGLYAQTGEATAHNDKVDVGALLWDLIWDINYNSILKPIRFRIFIWKRSK